MTHTRTGKWDWGWADGAEDDVSKQVKLQRERETGERGLFFCFFDHSLKNPKWRNAFFCSHIAIKVGATQLSKLPWLLLHTYVYYTAFIQKANILCI